MNYKLGSLFSGSGGFELAGSLCGIVPMWASEVEPFPIAVTRSRFPNMKHLGDISKINGAEIEPVDIITFGSPCQDLSVAGKRAGLKHEDNGDEETTRSGLFMEAVRIIKEMRAATNGRYPTFALWENVPGAFSSNKGEDFRIVLEELIKIVEPTASVPPMPKNGWPYADCYMGGGWSLAYRTFDAQYWGVPQRRRRIHLVADFRGERATEILFERDGLRGYFAESLRSWQGTAADAEHSAGTADREGKIRNLNKYDVQSKAVLDPSGIAPALYAGECRGGGGECYVLTEERIDDREGADGCKCLTPWDCQSKRIFDPNGVYPTLQAMSGGGANNTAVLISTDCIPINTMIATRHKALGRGTGFGVGEVGEPQFTISSNHEHAVCYTLKIRSGCEGGGKGALIQTDKSATLSTLNDQYLFQPMAAYSIENHPADSRVSIDESGKVQTLTSRMGTGGGNVPMVMEPVVFRKGTRPHSKDEAQKWEKAEVANTLNTFDQGEARANELIVVPIAISSKQQSLVTSDNLANTLGANDYKEPQAVVYCLQGNGIDRADTAGCNGKGVKEDISYTLNTLDRHAVAYAMQAIGEYRESEKSSSLKARDYKDATDLVVNEQPIALDRAFYNQGANAQYDPQLYEDGTCPTLVAKGPGAVCVRYIVRRLTPTECARLQGFADEWGHPDRKDDFTEEEYRFWLEVRNTHAAINGKTVKDYTKAQMLTWYNKLHTDSAEYKMWGNGIALPPALYCMQGIIDALEGYANG